MPINLQPHLVGELVELRPLKPADWDELFAVASDPLIWEQHPAHDRCKEDVFRDFFHKALEETQAARPGGAFAVIDRATGRIIGSTRYHGHDPQRSRIEIGWTFLARSHWGGRYNREMKRLMLDYIFRFVRTVELLVGPDNIRSQKAVERLGAVRDGVEEKADPATGRVTISLRYVLSRPE